MGLVVSKIYLRICEFFNGEEGQDLVEYSLIIALIALAATLGMRTLARHIGYEFFRVGAWVRYLVAPRSF